MPGPEATGDEPADVAVRPVLLAVGTFLVFAALLSAGLAAYYRVRLARTPPAGTTLFPEPRLQADPRVDLERLRADAEARLSATTWVDRGAAIVHVPIGDAMARVVARGAAGFDPIEGEPRVPSPARDAPARPAAGPAPTAAGPAR